jgi:hypothetical protein
MRDFPLLLALAAALSLPAARAQQPAAPSLGRLFSTPAEREALDAHRRNGGVEPAATAAAAAAPAEQAEPALPPVELNGIIRRSGGQSTIWLNDLAQPTGNDNLTGAARDTPGLKVNTPSGRRITLKPGQRYDFNDNRVKEANEP